MSAGHFSIPPFDDRPSWMKSRGYLHVTPKMDVRKRYEELYTKMYDENFVAHHAFFPLIHSVIKERKYKKHPKDPKKRGHSFVEHGIAKHNAKLRPLHYSTHIDAMIFSYYAGMLYEKYDNLLQEDPGLSACITAYRKIPVDLEEGEDVDDPKGKSTIHFANEAFSEIKLRAEDNGCIVLMFDIKSFFSELNHKKLKEAWCKLIGVDKLNAAHFNVFKASTDFRYILRDDLRINPKRKGRRSGFDERELARIRRETGQEAFFGSIDEFKEFLKSGKLTVYKHPFMKGRFPIGIPQGLPISAVLANLYLLDFDRVIFEKIVQGLGGYYRRYSDDILIVCEVSQASEVESLVIEAIKDRAVEISTAKTEKYLFESVQISPNVNRITSILLGKHAVVVGKPLTYLGFEFYGNKILIKSANIAKFYRRMIFAVKRKSSRAIHSTPVHTRPALFTRQLKKHYSELDLDKAKNIKGESKDKIKVKKLIKAKNGLFYYSFDEVDKKHKSNYFSYANRASRIMRQPEIAGQLRNHKRILNQAVVRHFAKKHKL